MYQYFAQVTKVTDGDTFDATLDLGFTVEVKQTFRLAKVNAPEKKGVTLEAGLKSKAELERLILGKKVIVHSFKPDTSIKQEKYGRYLAMVVICEGENKGLIVNEHLVQNGYAVAYM